MLQRLYNRFKFELERYIIRGPWHRLLVIIAAIGLISSLAGLTVFYEVGGFGTAADAIWWAFLRLTDPGYLGDDEGVGLRTVSTIVTVLGYVIFLGALIAIMTQWLNETLSRLHSGLTPIAQNNHIVILGWTNRTISIVQELVISEGRVRRFLGRRGVRKRLKIVILAEQVEPATIQDLKERLGARWNAQQIIFRTGSPLYIDHLKRIDYTHASAIILPAGEFGKEETGSSDGKAMKVLLSLANASQDTMIEKMPRLVVEMFDAQKVPIARRAYGGPMEILASDLLISRLIAQVVRQPGLSFILSELLEHSAGNEIYVRNCPSCEGLVWGDTKDMFDTAIPIGITQRHGISYQSMLNPPSDTVIQAEDRIILIAPNYEDARPSNPPSSLENPHDPTHTKTPDAIHKSEVQRILILGWNRKIHALIRELDSYQNERFDLSILSLVSPEVRAGQINAFDYAPQRVEIHHLEGDFTSIPDMMRQRPHEYHHVVIMASARMDTEAESDARSIMGYLILNEVFAKHETTPPVLIDLIEPSNADLLRQYPHETLITPMILSHLLTHVALRGELRSVFDALFGPQGPEIRFQSVEYYGLTDRPVCFPDIQNIVAKHGEIALGVRQDTGKNWTDKAIYLNPDKEKQWQFSQKDDLIVLTYDAL